MKRTYREETTLFDILERHASEQPHATAYVFLDNENGSTKISYVELLHRVQSIAAQLQVTHSAGDRVLLMYQPGLDFIEAILACFAAGMVAVPVQPLQTRRVLSKLTGIVENAGCRTLLTNKRTQQTLLRMCREITGAIHGVNWLCTDSVTDDVGADFCQQKLDSASLAILQYTSGSTGMPKGVMVSHGNLLNNEMLIQRAFGHDRKTVFVGWLPLYHDMGLIGNVFQPLYLGIPSILFSPMTFLTSPKVWLRAIADWRATTSGAPSFAYELCVNRIAEEEMRGVDLSSWKVAYNGAEPVKAKVMEAFSRKFTPYGFHEEAFYPCYGMAEATLFISGGSPEAKPKVLVIDPRQLACNFVREDLYGTPLVSCGRPYGDHRVEIVDPNSLQVLADDQIGEIWVAGASVASGYWANAELSATTFCAYTASGVGPFLRTGDLGFCHHGELFITGRLKDLIIVRGQNHYPDDIEATIYESHDTFKPNGAAAFTVGDESEMKLVVVAEVQRHALTQLSQHRYQTLLSKSRKDVSDKHGLRLADLTLIRPSTLPKTSSGKVRRSHCRDLYCHNKLDAIVIPAPSLNRHGEMAVLT